MNAPKRVDAELYGPVVGGQIQGGFGRALSCRPVLRLAYGFGHLANGARPDDFAIMHDALPGSASLAEATSPGPHVAGHDVLHLGLGTVPRLAWHIREAGLCGGIMIGGGSAAPRWNTIALFRRGALPVPAGHVLGAVCADDLNQIVASTEGLLWCRDSPQDYAAHLRTRRALRGPLRLCLDAGNELDALLADATGLGTWRTAFDSDALSSLHRTDLFAPTTLAELSDTIRRNGCELGAAISADGDTLAVPHERGRAIASDALGAPIAGTLTSRRPGLRVSHTPDCRSPLRGTLAHAGSRIEIAEYGPGLAQPSGEIDLHFDATGHYVFGELPGTPSVLPALIEQLNGLTGRPVPLSQHVAELDTQPTATSVA